MEGRRGGGGGRSSGKGPAGRVMSLHEFVSTMAPLIDLEKAAEISSESEASSKRLERRGSVMPNLKCTDAQTGLMGKTLLEFQPNKGDVLPPHKS